MRKVLLLVAFTWRSLLLMLFYYKLCQNLLVRTAKFLISAKPGQRAVRIVCFSLWQCVVVSISEGVTSLSLTL